MTGAAPRGPSASASGVAGFESAVAGVHDPIEALHLAFRRGAGELRQQLFGFHGEASALGAGTRELDRLVELEGDLSIELGKLTHRALAAFRAEVYAQPALAEELARPRATGAAGDGRAAASEDVEAGSLAGWSRLRLSIEHAVAWARRAGDAGLVRTLHRLHKEAVCVATELLLDHQNALDVLAAQCARERRTPSSHADARDPIDVAGPVPSSRSITPAPPTRLR